MYTVLLSPDLGSLDSGLTAHFQKQYQRKNAILLVSGGVGVVILTCH